MALKVAERKPYHLEINDVLDAFGLIINQYNALLASDEQEEHRILYVATFPDEIFNPTGDEVRRKSPMNIVTYEIMRRENGTMGSDPYAGTREVRPHAREEEAFQDDNGVDHIRTIKGKWYDNTVRFECFAPSAKQANELIHRVEGIYEIHAPWLDSIGTIKTIYAGRTTPSYSVKTTYHSRAFQVYVKTERLWYIDDTVINNIQIEAGDELERLIYRNN